MRQFAGVWRDFIRAFRDFQRAFEYALAKQDLSGRELVRWHRRELMRLDPIFLINQAGVELCRRREAFHENGGKISDPAYPELNDVLREWSENPINFDPSGKEQKA